MQLFSAGESYCINLLSQRELLAFIDTISSDNKKKISKFLYQKLCFYFEGFERLKSFRVIKDIFHS